MEPWLWTFLSVGLVSGISLIGALTLTIAKEKLRDIILGWVSFAVGGLFGNSFIHLLPEAFEELGYGVLTCSYTLIGIVLFFILEKFIRWRHCHIFPSSIHLHPVVTMNLVGDGVHNLIDGILIAVSYSIDISLGVATTVAIILHEVPQEMGDLGVLLYGGLPPKRALLFNFLLSLTSIIGAGIFLIMGNFAKRLAKVMVPITAGGFIYIAGADLIPELQHDVKAYSSLKQLLFIIVGIGIMAALAFF